SIRAKLGACIPVARAAAPATGDISATPAQASERSQSPTVRLSSGTLATVQPIRMPATVAITAIRNQQRVSTAVAVRRRTASALAKITAASPTPPAACQRQYGWLETRAPPGNFASRREA